MRRAVQPQTSTHPTHRRVPPTPIQSLAKHNRKPSQLTENNHQHPKSIASFCRIFDEFTVPPYSRKTKLRALTATSRFEKIANPMKTKEKRFSNRNKISTSEKMLHQNQTTTNNADLLRGHRKSKRTRLKLKRSRQMLGEITPIMPTRIQMKFMRDPARRQQLVELGRALIEPKLIVSPAIKINLQSYRPRPVLHNRKRALAPPKRRIHLRTERLAQNLRHRRGLIARNLDVRQSFDQRRTMRAHRHKQIRILQRKAQRAIPSHRNAHHPARFSLRAHPVVALNVRQKLAYEKIFIPHLAVARIDVEAAPRIRRHYQKFPNPFLVAQILNHVHPAGIQQQLLVSAQPM